MDDLLAHLGVGERVLDLGSGLGSFSYERYSCQIVAVDTQAPAAPRAGHAGDWPRQASGRIAYVVGRGAAIPLECECVDVVVGNHLFEHLADPVPVAREIARVLRASGILFATIPDGASFSDRFYRLWTLGGGHLQRLSLRGLQEIIERNTDLELLYSRRLYASFSFLHPRPEIAIHLPRRSQLLKHLPPWARNLALALLNTATRLPDALFGARLSFYGWACYFGRPAAQIPPVRREEFLNVCARCGAGHPCEGLERRRFFHYRCPQCGGPNPYFGEWFARRITGRPWEEEELPHSLPEKPPADGAPVATGVPTINTDGVVNAASYSAAISPRSLIAVFGKNFAGADAALLVNGRPVLLLYLSNEQLTAYLPPDIPRGAATFQVRSGGRTGPAIAVPLFLTAPGLFSRDPTGQGIAALLGSPRPGEQITLLATGLGPVTPDGRTTRACRVWIGGQRAAVEYCGLRREPGHPGVYEVRVRIPHGAAGANASVQAVAGGRPSNVLTLGF